MAAPSSYTEATFFTYLKGIIGQFASMLAWTAQANYQAAIDETLLVYGNSDITAISGTAAIRKLRAIGRREVWRAIKQALHLKVNDSGTMSALYDAIGNNINLAEADCLQFGVDYYIGKDTIDHIHDPYQYREEDDRVI